MPTTVLFNSLDRTLVSEDWLAATDVAVTGCDSTFVDCAGLPFCGDQVSIPPIVVEFARVVHMSSTVVVALPMGVSGACGVFETAVAWLSRKEICHVMRGKRVVIQIGVTGAGPSEWPRALLRDFRCVGAVCEVRTSFAAPVTQIRRPRRLNDWVGKIEAEQAATC